MKKREESVCGEKTPVFQKFNTMKLRIAIVGSILIFLSICQVESKKTKKVALESKETTTANFVKLVLMRLIFGLASAMGWGESLSTFMNGAFVPPGADDYDDYGDELIPGIF